jgi:hypothetical protein
MEVKISSLEELAACLRGGRLPVKLAALREVHNQLQQARRAGQKLHPALIDLLHERYETTEDKDERTWCACLLFQVDDDRKYVVAEQEFFAQDDNAVLVLCADTIAPLPPSRRVALLADAVADGGSATRQRLAANLLSDCTALLSPEKALRVAILSDHNLPIEEVSADTLNLWIGELSGPYRLSVRRILGAKPPSSIVVLIENWRKLPADVATWGIAQVVRKKIPATRRILREILETGEDVAVLKCALNALTQFPIADRDDRALETLLRHEERSVRAAALAAGRTALPWGEWLDEGVSDEERLAVLCRIARYRHEGALSHLSPLLQDRNWKIRARATDALVSLAPDSLKVLQVHLASDNPEAKASAVQALQRLGHDDWVLAAIA